MQVAVRSPPLSLVILVYIEPVRDRPGSEGLDSPLNYPPLYRLLGFSLYRVPIATWNESGVSSRSPEFPPLERGSIELFRGETAATGGECGRIARPKGAHVSWFTDICIICVIDPSFHARERFLAPRRARSSPSAFPPASRGNRDHASPHDTTIVRGYRIGRSYRSMSLNHSQRLGGAGRGIKIDGRDRFKKD